MSAPLQHFLEIADYSKESLLDLLDLAEKLKKQKKTGKPHRALDGKSLCMIFEKPSNRTRVSFELGMKQLGGDVVNLGGGEVQLGRRESIPDVARVLSRYADLVMIRTFEHNNLLSFAQHATVPVINGLTDKCHPCQAMADVLTIREHKGALEGLKLCYVGDGNNVAYSLVSICNKLGIEVVISTPKGYELEHDGEFAYSEDPFSAVEGADVIYTDVWTSMGMEDERAKRLKDFEKYQVTPTMLEHANSGCIFMHCLPAHRGEEVSDAVMESSASAVFDQAENRLHAQKAILQTLGGQHGKK